jgi:photosystem II oxygen-evolving enhancer protein 3
VLAGFVAAGAALLSASQAQAVTPVDLFDDRKARNTGFDLIYEARDLDLPQAERDGMTQARSSIEATKKRIKESEARIDNAVAPSIEKAYW